MRFRSIIGSATAIALLAVPALMAAAPAQAQESSRQLGTRSLAKVLAKDGVKFDTNSGDFDIVEAAVYAVAAAKPDSPVLLLADGRQRLTAFVPTDLAFRNLVKALTGKTYYSEKRVFNKIAALVPIDLLETTLLYHVVPGATITAAKALQADGVKLATAAGPKLRVKVVGGKVKLIDKDPDTRAAVVIVPDINKGNRQIAHGINAVLLPADL
jgi:uncharacterized surface protein with fasciclin (FAS1) repeats